MSARVFCSLCHFATTFLGFLAGVAFVAGDMAGTLVMLFFAAGVSFVSEGAVSIQP